MKLLHHKKRDLSNDWLLLFDSQLQFLNPFWKVTDGLESVCMLRSYQILSFPDPSS